MRISSSLGGNHYQNFKKNQVGEGIFNLIFCYSTKLKYERCKNFTRLGVGLHFDGAGVGYCFLEILWDQLL